MGIVKGKGHMVSLVSNGFYINRTRNSGDHDDVINFFLEFELANSRSRLCVRSMLMLIQYQSNAFHFRFTSIRPIIPELWPVECLTLKNNQMFKKIATKFPTDSPPPPQEKNVI